MGTFVVDGEGLVLVEDLVAADVAVLGRTVGVAGVDLQDLLVGRPALVGVGHVRRLAELGRVLVDVVDADVHRRAAENQSRNKKTKKKNASTSVSVSTFSSASHRRRPLFLVAVGDQRGAWLLSARQQTTHHRYTVDRHFTS